MNDSVLAIDAMGGLGEELAWRLLSKDELGLLRIGDEVSWVALAKAELEMLLARGF